MADLDPEYDEFIHFLTSYIEILIDSCADLRNNKDSVYSSPNSSVITSCITIVMMSQAGDWHLCNPENLFRFYLFYMHLLVYVWIFSST